MKDGRKDASDRQVKQSFFTQPGSLGHSRVDMLLQKAAVHHADGQWPQAEALYRQILESLPSILSRCICWD